MLTKTDNMRTVDEFRAKTRSPETGANARMTVQDFTLQLERRTRQQAVVAELGQLALQGERLSALFQAAAEQVADALGQEFCKVLELLPGEEQVKLVAGVGWKPGLVGQAKIDTGLDSQAGYTLRSREPVVVTDLRRETRFSGPPLLHDHGVVSGLSVVIGPPDDPWGVFGTHTARCVDYTIDDIHFVQGVSNLLWEAIERNQQGRTIRKQLAEIDAVYANAPVGLSFYDRDLQYVRINDRLAEINGFPAADHIGKTLSDLLPDIAAQVEPLLRQVIETGEAVVDVEVQGTTPAHPQVERDWIVSYIPLITDEEVAGVHAVVFEITEQKRAEQRLRDLNTSLEEQVRLRTGMIEMLHDIASQAHEAASLPEAVSFVLRRVAEYNGWSFGHAYLVPRDAPDRLVPFQAYYEQDGDAFREFREVSAEITLSRGAGLPGRALETGEAVWAQVLPDDLRADRADVIDRLPIESAAAFPVTVNGRIELVLEFFCTHRLENDKRFRQGMQDIGVHLARTIERLRAERTLRESEVRFRELAESINHVFWVMDPASTQLLYLSPEWSRIVAAPPSEDNCDIEQWRSYVHPEDRARVDEAFADEIGQGRCELLYRVVRTDGAIRWIRDVAVPIPDDSGGMLRILGVAEDITERRELEREIADATTREQKRLSRDLHDSIGQELTGLTMMAARLAEDLKPTSPEGSEAVGSLVAGLRRTLQQVRRISRGLAPVDIEAGGLTLALAQLADQTSLAATSACVFRGDELVTISDPGVANHLHSIAQEAVANAVRHAQAQTITVTLRSDGGFCELSVRDDGRGLPESQEPPREGMGLKIMRYRSDLINGQLRIDSAPSRGTQITCRVRQHRSTE